MGLTCCIIIKWHHFAHSPKKKIMNLQTDQQTLDDLRIFGKGNEAGLYDLFNNMYTRGGEVLLREMFTHPLGDETAINTRRNIIEQFSKQQIGFPFNGALFDMAEKYMMEDRNSARTLNSSMGEKEIA